MHPISIRLFITIPAVKPVCCSPGKRARRSVTRCICWHRIPVIRPSSNDWSITRSNSCSSRTRTPTVCSTRVVEPGLRYIDCSIGRNGSGSGLDSQTSWAVHHCLQGHLHTDSAAGAQSQVCYWLIRRITVASIVHSYRTVTLVFRVTQHVISSRVDPRLNVYAIEVLVKQGLLQGPSYDAHLASIVDRYVEEFYDIDNLKQLKLRNLFLWTC